MAAAGSGVLADSGCKGPGAWLLRGCGLCFPVLGSDGPSERKKGGRATKNKGRFWRAKASLFGRESVAAFLVGDLGCAYRDLDSADFRLDAALPRPRDLSVSRRRLSNLSLPTCLPVSRRHSPAVWPVSSRSLVTFSWTVTTANLIKAFPMLGVLDAGRAGTCRQGANLNNCGQR